MTLDNLITLITAGFTKQEILTMSGMNTQRAPQPQPQPSPNLSPYSSNQFYSYSGLQNQYAPQGGQPQPNAQGYAQQNPQAGAQVFTQAGGQMGAYMGGQQVPQGMAQQMGQIRDNNDVMTALNKLTSAVQSNNVNMMQNQVPKVLTTEDAIANIINPPNYEGLTEGGDK
jgi:hypothetical protein